MKIRHLVAVFLVVLLTDFPTTSIFAADDPAAELCKALFSQSIQDQHDTYTLEEHFRQYQTILKSHTFQSYQQLQQAAGKLHLDIPLLDDLIGIDAQAQMNNQRFHELYTAFQNATWEQVQSKSSIIDINRRINTALVSAFRQCEADYFNTLLDRLTQIIIVTPQNPPDSFLLKIAVRFPGPLRQEGLEISDIQPHPPITCFSGDKKLRYPQQFRDTEVLLNCTKPVDKEFSIQIRTNAGVTKAVTVPRRKTEVDALQEEISALSAQLRNTQQAQHNMVAAFHGPCPEAQGWHPFALADGRFLRGTSGEVGVAEGRPSVTLSLENLPPHVHPTVEAGDTDPTFGNPPHSIWSTTNQDQSRQGGGWTVRGTGQNSNTGPPIDGRDPPKPFDIIPPYVSVNYCIKD